MSDLVRRLRGYPGKRGMEKPPHVTMDEAADYIEKLEAALRRCDKLFSDIRNDWSDPRSACRKGRSVIEEALEGKDD